MRPYRRREVFGLFACLVLVIVVSGCGALSEIGHELAAERAAERERMHGGGFQAGSVGPQAIVNPNASTLEAMRAHGDLSKILNGFESAEIAPNITSPTTLLVPTNAAFDRMPTAMINALLNDRVMLQRVLSHHILDQQISKEQLLQQTEVMTRSGYPLTVSQASGGPKLSGTNFIRTDIPFRDGVMHKIDRLLFPPPPNGMAPPVIDSSGVATFKGDFLTAVGSAEPNMRVLLQSNGVRFGSALVGADGTWLIANNITPGDYELVAYMLRSDNVPLAVSEPVYLIVTE